MRSTAYALARRIAALIPARLFRVQTKCVNYLPRDRWKDPDDDHVRIGNESDAAGLAELVDAESVASRFERGAMVIVYEIDGRVVGAMWFDEEPRTYEEWLLIDIGPSVCWITDVVVDPDYRGRGIAGRISTFGRSELPEHVDGVASVVTGMNQASRRSVAKAGYDSVCLFYVRLLGVTAVRLPSGWRVGTWGRSAPLTVELSSLFG